MPHPWSVGLRLTCLVALVISGCYGAMSEPSFETLDTLFDVEDRVNIRFLRDPVPLHRKDLGADSISYWQFTVNDNEYIIISASPNTGDYKLVFQGPLPSMTELLDQSVWVRAQKCSRYFMLSPDVTLMCEDENKEVIATTKDHYLDYKSMNSHDPTLRYRFTEEHFKKLEIDWADRVRDIEEDGIWNGLSVIPAEMIPHVDQEELQGGQPFILRRGQTVKIAFTGREEIRFHSLDHAEQQLCNIFNVCTRDREGLVKTSLAQKTSYGVSYIALTVPVSLRGENIRFNVHVRTDLGLVIKPFIIDLSRRSKRATYSDWTEISIGNEELFPDFRQFDIDGCSVGCGAVAWSMIFGYLDRRSHLQESIYGNGSQGLFRCDIDGTSGDNNCTAPANNNNALERYMYVLRGVLKTFCLFGEGATTQGNMDNIEGFFIDRQTTGAPRITSHKRLVLSFLGAYSSDIRDTGLAALRAGWPIIPGIKLSGLFSQHYPVATKYRSRVKTYKKCFLWICSDKRTTEYEMYLHMGFGGIQNGWRAGKMFFVTYAKY